jgi:phosphatidylglycerophosphate synthase
MVKFELTKFFNQVIKFSPDVILRINRFQNWLWRLEGFKSVGLFSVFFKKIFQGKINTDPHTILMIPNLLSLFRLIAVLVAFIIGFVIGVNKWFYLIIYLMLMSLDLIDGPIARQTGTVSVLGMFLDPIADKICHLSIILIAVFFGFIPVWFLTVSIVKELFSGVICGYRSIGSARWFAKTASLLELMVLLLAFLIPIQIWIFVLLIIIQISVLVAYLTIKI